VSLAAANHDPLAFDHADDLLLDRSPNPHVAFGAGVHFCLGAHVARIIGQVVLGELLDRWRAIEPDGALVRHPSLWNRGLLRLPLRGIPA
jgi:pimeloyl-[acyl-carrier protein] synthase